jgi:PKD repeat protein
VNVGETVNFDASGTTDPGSADTHTFAWDFDDGAAGTGVAPSHVYASIGVYTATLTVTDDDGGVDTDEVVITVVSPSDLDSYQDCVR